MKPDPDRYVLTLQAVADPLERTTGETREPTYRLRLALMLLLRSFGLRCERVGPAGGDKAVSVEVAK